MLLSIVIFCNLGKTENSGLSALEASKNGGQRFFFKRISLQETCLT